MAILRDQEPIKVDRQSSVAHEMIVRLIESEINAAYIFVNVAENCYRCGNLLEGTAALSKAEAIYAQASTLAQDNGTQATADSLRELRRAIDGLASTQVRPGEHKK